MAKDILLIGPLDMGRTPKAGDSIKNRYLLSFFEQNYQRVGYIDTQRWKRNPLVLLRVVWALLMGHHRRIVISTFRNSAYRLLQLAGLLHTRSQIYYFEVGGYTAECIRKGQFKVEPYRKCSHIVVEADRLVEAFRSLGLDNACRLYNFKPVAFRADYERNSQGALRFVFFARMLREKGIFDILDACSTLNESGLASRYEVDFYGRFDPAIEQEFMTRLEALPNVAYKGFLDLRDEANYAQLAAYDVMLFPTLFPTEGCPGTIIDALIAGLPVIASRWTLAEEFIGHERCGWLFDMGDTAALTRLMQKAVTQPDTLKPLRRQCGIEADKYRLENVLTPDLLRQLGM